MKITNNQNLPQAIVDAVQNDLYSRGSADISVSQLIDPPRKVELRRIHEDNIEEDASDRIWTLLGQSIHTILERANKSGIAERRLSITVEGWKISGGMDLYEDSGFLTDYKTTSAYSFTNKSNIKKWEEQLNVYAQILRENGHKINGLKVVAILRDWSTLEAKRERDFPGSTYPKSQVAEISLPLWGEETAKLFIKNRVVLHQKARQELPLCSDEERWKKKDQWAVKKKGASRATKLHDNQTDAEQHALRLGSEFFVEFRRGGFPHCESYCAVAKFCDQWKASFEVKKS